MCIRDRRLTWNTHGGRRYRLTRLVFEPVKPLRPPGAALARRLPSENIRINIAIARAPSHHLVAMVQMSGLRDNPRIMPAGRQQVADIGVGLLNDLVSRAPGSDVIADGTNGEDRCADIGECDRPTIGLEVSRGQFVI